MRGKDASRVSSDEVDADGPTRLLSEFVQKNADMLARTVRMYVIRFGVARGAAVPEVALEVLQETVVEALRSAHRFDSAQQPTGWLIAIAIKVILRRRVTEAKRHKREVAVQDIAAASGKPSDARSDEEIFDRLASLTVGRDAVPVHTNYWTVSLAREDVAQNFESDAAAEAILSGASAEDAAILRLAVLHEMDSYAVAERLGIDEPGTARVRLHRAIKRVRKTLKAVKS